MNTVTPLGAPFLRTTQMRVVLVKITENLHILG